MILASKYSVANPDTNPDGVSGFDHPSPIDSGIPTTIPTKCRDSRLPDGKGMCGAVIEQMARMNLPKAALDAAVLEANRPVTAPGVQPSYGIAKVLITDDCNLP